MFKIVALQLSNCAKENIKMNIGVILWLKNLVLIKVKKKNVQPCGKQKTLKFKKKTESCEGIIDKM
jgi:hypothetical protein